jgi:hypothetical protein
MTGSKIAYGSATYHEQFLHHNVALKGQCRADIHNVWGQALCVGEYICSCGARWPAPHGWIYLCAKKSSSDEKEL